MSATDDAAKALVQVADNFELKQVEPRLAFGRYAALEDIIEGIFARETPQEPAAATS